jgi:tetratricopeptide (TPR) repeat protein
MIAEAGTRSRYWRWFVAAIGLAILGGVAWSVRADHLRQSAIIDRAKTALRDRDLESARDSITAYLIRRPDDPEALLIAARCARKRKEDVGARDALRRYRLRGGDASVADVESLLIDLMRGDLRSVPLLRQRAEEDDETALEILEVLIQYDIDTYQLWSAIHGLTHYLRVRPDDLHALLGRGFVWERFLYFQDALKDYRAAAAAHPQSRRARLKLAQTLLVVGTPADALIPFGELEASDPIDIEVQLGLARCDRMLANPAEARKRLQALRTGKNPGGEVFLEYGHLEQDEGRLPEAESLFRKAVELLPYDRRTHFALYRCLVEMDRVAEATVVNDRVRQIDSDLSRLDRIRQDILRTPDHVGLRCEGARLFLRNGERPEGLRWYRHALKVDPSCEEARKALAGKTDGRD